MEKWSISGKSGKSAGGVFLHPPLEFGPPNFPGDFFLGSSWGAFKKKYLKKTRFFSGKFSGREKNFPCHLWAGKPGVREICTFLHPRKTGVKTYPSGRRPFWDFFPEMQKKNHPGRETTPNLRKIWSKPPDSRWAFHRNCT